MTLLSQTSQSLYSGPWTPSLVGALFVGLIGLTGAIVAGIIKLLAAQSANQAVNVASAKETKDDIKQVHGLVNNAHEKLYNEVTSLKAANSQALAETAALRAIISTLNITAARAEGVIQGSQPTVSAGGSAIPTPVVVVNPASVPVPTTVIEPPPAKLVDS